jgi:hypothetical protein
MTTPDEAKQAALENFQAQHDVACRTGTAISVIPFTWVVFYAGFDAGHASRDAEVEGLQADVEAAKADRNERHAKVVEFMNKYEASRKAALEEAAVIVEMAVMTDEGLGIGSAADLVDAIRSLALSPVGGGDGGGR